MREIEARLVLTQDDVVYLWNGGTLAVKIEAPDARVSVDVSCSRSGSGNGKRQSLRIKRIQAKREPA
ncbi:MAG: hypothetical protein KatS3mg131_2027 [Candidatus Tectimicrobiota bacterium]|nr:MAG: hypothetical protein KatS3mg131_2027 [Candidatus Tectomicrobia bacterium]